MFFQDTSVLCGSNGAGASVRSMWRPSPVLGIRPGFKALTAIRSGAQRLAASTMNKVLAVLD